MAKKHLVIGYLGEVGTAIFNVLARAKEYVSGQDITTTKGFLEDIAFDFLHICIPDSDIFIPTVQQYIEKFGHEKTITIIHSTIRPSTTKSISEKYPRIAYSPVRGVHPHLEKYIRRFIKFFATENGNIVLDISAMCRNVGIPCKLFLDDPTTLEFAKHYCTLFYLKEIVFAQDIARTIQENNLSPEIIVDFINTTGDRRLLPYAQRVGGHCLIPNAVTLSKFSSLAGVLIQQNEQYLHEYGLEKFFFLEKDRGLPLDPYAFKVGIKNEK